MDDLTSADTRGRWWIVGSAWTGKNAESSSKQSAGTVDIRITHWSGIQLVKTSPVGKKCNIYSNFCKSSKFVDFSIVHFILDNNYKYSQGSNTERSKTEYIRKPNVSKFGFRMVQTIRKPNFYHSKTELSKWPL